MTIIQHDLTPLTVVIHAEERPVFIRDERLALASYLQQIINLRNAAADAADAAIAAAEIAETSEGLPGPPGPPGPPGAINQIYLATQATGGHRLVRTDGLDNVVYASCDDQFSIHNVLGMTLNAANAGDEVSVIRLGEAEESSWSWVPGLPVYLGLNGVPTQTLPGEATFGLIVGFPLTPTKLFVCVREPIVFN